MTVPAEERDPAKTCNTDGCNAWATDQSDNTRCRHCGGESTGPKTEEGKQTVASNAVTHGIYAEENRFYQDVMTDRQQALCDEIFQDLCTRFRELHADPLTHEQARMFEIAVNHIKVVHSDNWLADKPDELESGNPMVDKSQRFNSEGVPYEEYKETVVLKGQQKLKKEDRQWLKDNDMLHSAEQRAAEGTQALAEIWAEQLE